MKPKPGIANRLSILSVAIILAVSVFQPQAAVRADAPTERPGDVAPLLDGSSEETGAASSVAESPNALSSAGLLSSTSNCMEVYQAGGDRLAALQNNDGGWDWPLDDGNPANASPVNTIGPIGMGLAQAYYHTYDPDHKAALMDVGTLLLSKKNNFSPSDGYLAAELDRVFGGTTYGDHVNTYFYGPLAAGTYNRLGLGTLYDTAGYVNLIRTARQSQGIPNLAAWDIGLGLVGAAAAGADTSAWLAGVKAEIDELSGSGYYDVIGLAGAVYGLAFVGEDYDPTAGEHAAAESLSDLANILADYQINWGGFTWNKNFISPGNETAQETAYAILALREVNPVAYAAAIQGAANYLITAQLLTGGWENYTAGGENNEVTGEALWGISAAFAGEPVASNVLADPNPAAVGSSVNLSAVVDSAGTSCMVIASAEYSLDGGSWVAMSPGDGAFDSPTESVAASLTAPSDAGIFDLCVRGTDAAGNVGEPECIMLVVYDPSAGFVTGGGWIDSPAGAVPSSFAEVFYNGFEIDTSGWLVIGNATVTRVSSGNNGVASSSGNYHAEVTGDAADNYYGPFTRWDGYHSAFPTGGYVTTIDVYLDVNGGYANDTRFEWSSAINQPNGNHRRDFVFNAGFYNDSTGPGAGQNRFVISASTNATRSSAYPKNPDKDPIAITQSGWYTFQHRFYDNGAGVLAVDLSIFDAYGSLVKKWTISDPTDIIGSTVGGNRYGWLVIVEFPFLAIDDTARLEQQPPVTGKATFGFVSKYKKGASVPEGQTEFVFKAGDLNFHSTTYEWLVVNKQDKRAQYKGSGTINGAGVYKFMLWASDGAPDTFRIKIWWEDETGEHVVYDNGFAGSGYENGQPIAGGNIVIHTGKN